MERAARIRQLLEEELRPEHLAVVDESHGHSVPAGSESHFNLVVVSSRFAGAGRLERHRRVQALLAGEMQHGLHAMTLTLATPDEWTARGGEALASPACRGGSKRS